MRLLSTRAAHALLAVAAFALGACSEHANTTQPTPQDPNALIICCDDGGGGGGGGDPPPPPVSVKTLWVSSPGTVEVNFGPGLSYTATVYNSSGTLSNVRIQGFVVQNSTRRAATPLAFIQCGSNTAGTLPNGINCSFSGTLFASNSNNGTGNLVAGSASFELQVQSGSGTLLAWKSVPVTLTAAISGWNMQSTTIDIAGTSVPYSVTLQNTGSSLSNVSVEGTVIQGSASRFAGGESVFCGLSLGTLPTTSSCSVSLDASVTNGATGPGTLMPGSATLQISLYQGLALLATRSIPVTLVSTLPRITAINPGANPVLIGGGSRPFTATISNSGVSRSGMQFQGFIHQGSARHASTGGSVDCGSGAGVVPNGTCTISSAYVASNSLAGSGTLAPGNALFELELRNASGTVVSTDSVSVTLVALPSITSLTPGSSSALIGGPSVSYSATVQNTGPGLTNVSAQGTIIQGTASRDAGSLSVNCGSGTGTLPNGTCTFAGAFVATNGSVGSGTLAVGPATLQIELADPANGVLATRTVAITLVAATPKISNVTLSSTELTLEDFSQTYTATLDNPGPSLPNVALLVVITQPSTQRSAGGQTIACGPGGVEGLPTGTCDVPGGLLVSNSGEGFGTLVPGAATVVFQLIDGNSGTLLDTKSVPVNLLSGVVLPPIGM